MLVHEYVPTCVHTCVYENFPQVLKKILMFVLMPCILLSQQIVFSTSTAHMLGGAPDSLQADTTGKGWRGGAIKARCVYYHHYHHNNRHARTNHTHTLYTERGWMEGETDRRTESIPLCALRRTFSGYSFNLSLWRRWGPLQDG